MTKLTIEHFCKGIDLEIEQIKNHKQWYLDYRVGSGMSPMLEEFADFMDKQIARLEAIKQYAKSIDPHSLLNQRP